MTIKKKRKTPAKRRKKKQQIPDRRSDLGIKVESPLSVEVTSSAPSSATTTTTTKKVRVPVFTFLTRLFLFLIGASPYVVWIFQVMVLREHVDPNLWIMIPCLILMVAIANISDDKISQSGKSIVTIAVRARGRVGGGTAEHSASESQDK